MDTINSHNDRDALDGIEGLLNVIEALVLQRETLRTDNMAFKEKLENLTAELKGINTTISATKADISLYESKADTINDSISVLLEEKEKLINQINSIKSSIKAASDDLKNCISIKEHLSGEHSKVDNERKAVVNRLESVQKAIGEIIIRKTQKLPDLLEYDKYLRLAFDAFKETENRIALSVRLISH